MNNLKMWHWVYNTYLKIFLLLWTSTAVGASVMHLFTAEYLVSLTSWQYAHGWQMEIAFFDLAWSGFIIYSLMTKNHSLQKKITVVLGCLSAFLGTNHLSGFFIEGKPLHLIFSLLNYLAVASAILVFVAGKSLSQKVDSDFASYTEA